MKNNFSHLIREELVKRFEDVVKEEMRQHRLAIQSYEKKILNFEDSIDWLKIKFNELKNLHEKVNRISEESMSKVDQITREQADQSKYISSEMKEGKKTLQHLNDEIESFVSRKDFEENSDQLYAFFNESLSEIDRFFRLQLSEFKKDFFKYCQNIDEQFSEVITKIELLEKVQNNQREQIEENRQKLTAMKRRYEIESKTTFVNEKTLEYIVAKLKKFEDEK